MGWIKKIKQDTNAAAQKIQPSPLSVSFDEDIFNSKLQQLILLTSRHGGLDFFIDVLKHKQEIFFKILMPGAIDDLDRVNAEHLLMLVFPSRRVFAPLLAATDFQKFAESLRHLLYAESPLDARILQFVRQMEGQDRKVQRATWDFAAECLHGTYPEQYPLMCRWVWHQGTHSGALREFIRGNDAMNTIELGNDAGMFESVRLWFAQQLAAQGYRRDISQITDLLLALAYAEYLLAMSSGMGMMGSEFGAKTQPMEIVVKLLGLDDRRPPSVTPVTDQQLH